MPPLSLTQYYTGRHSKLAGEARERRKQDSRETVLLSWRVYGRQKVLMAFRNQPRLRYDKSVKSSEKVVKL